MRRKLTFALVAVGLVTIAGVAFAGPWSHGGFNHERVKKFVDWRIGSALDDVDATPQQRKVVSAEKDALIAEAEAIMKRRGEMKDAFLGAWTSEKPDRDALHKMVDDRVDEWRALAHRAVDAGLKVHGTLEPSQRAALAEELGQSCGGH